MDQALKSLMASEEEVVTSLDLSGQWRLLSAHLLLHLRLFSVTCWGREGHGASKLCLLSLSQLCSSLLSSTPPPLCHLHCLPLLCPHISPCYTTPCSKCGDLEEELKIVTNNLKSLEAQADKVEGGRGAVRMGSCRGVGRWAQAGRGWVIDGDRILSSLWGSDEK